MGKLGLRGRKQQQEDASDGRNATAKKTGGGKASSPPSESEGEEDEDDDDLDGPRESRGGAARGRTRVAANEASSPVPKAGKKRSGPGDDGKGEAHGDLLLKESGVETRQQQEAQKEEEKEEEEEETPEQAAARRREELKRTVAREPVRKKRRF